MRKLFAAALLATFSAGAQAAVIITAVENVGGVVFTLESGGSLDISGMLYGLNIEAASDGLIRPSANAIRFGPAGEEYAVYQGISGLAFGGGSIAIASSYAGDPDQFGFGGDELYLPVGYNSGDIISGGSMSFAGETFASLGIDLDTHVYTLLGSNDTITLNAVPIPAAAWLFGSSLAGLGWMRRKSAA